VNAKLAAMREQILRVRGGIGACHERYGRRSDPCRNAERETRR
jgi:ferredoxin-thioredoxin reductase catalytic subunit